MTRKEDRRDNCAVKPDLDNQKQETAEESALIESGNMPEVINTGVSTPAPSGQDMKRGPELSVCFELQRGAEITAQKVGSGCGKYWANTCSVANLKKTLPIVNWLPNYRLKTLKCDFIAGLTVGLTVIPQAMAYAALAGLELQFGLYSAFMGCFIYCLMGTSKDITMGPTAIMSILVAEYAHDPWTHGVDSEETTNVTLAILLTFLCGIIQILMTVFRLGFLVRYISHPVITGFTSAASIVIALSLIHI